ncbi:MAG: ATP-grasp domain-containing protein [Bacteroidales bacterium]|nr:ATP-grasp domain-containing protein [Bacteroidales bacterium]
MKKNILISCAGRRVALTRGFKEALKRFFPGSKVLATDCQPHLAAATYVADGCYQVPRLSDPSYFDTLCEICRKHDVKLIIPTLDTELMLLASKKEELKEMGVNVAVSDESFIAMCRDKRKTIAFFKSHNMDVPREVDKHNPTFPLFAKPYDGSLSANLHHIKCAEELTPTILADEKLIFMEYVDHSQYKEFTVDMYYGTDHNVKCIVPRERVEVRGGEICKGRTVKNDIIDWLKDRLGHIEGCEGSICVQLFYHPVEKRILCIEINPRFGGGYPLSLEAGANFPELLIREHFLEEEIHYFDSWTDGKLMLRFDDAIYV